MKEVKRTIKKRFHGLLKGTPDYKKNFVNSVFLIDGHYTFLYCLEKNQTELFKNKKSVEISSSDKLMQETKDDIYRKINNPELAESVIKSLYGDKQINRYKKEIERLEKFRGEDLVPYFSEYVWIFQNEFNEIFLDKIGLNTENTLLNIESLIFDAHHPNKDEPLGWFIKNKEAALEWGRTGQAKLLDTYIEKLNHGVWDFYHEGKFIRAPYDTKKSYLDFLESSFAINPQNKTEVVLAKRHVHLRGSYIADYEKGVDTSLVIKGCEYAEDSDTRFVCLITNDGDFEPLVEHIQSKGKQVFLLSLVEEERVCKALKEAIGKENCFNISHEIFSLNKKENDSSQYSSYAYYLWEQQSMEYMKEQEEKNMKEMEEWYKNKKE